MILDFCQSDTIFAKSSHTAIGECKKLQRGVCDMFRGNFQVTKTTFFPVVKVTDCRAIIYVKFYCE